MKQAVAYLRVSTSNQVGDDKFGLVDQKQSIETYAKANDFEIIAWYSDEGISGGTLDRPALQQLLTSASSKTFSAVLVAKTDRLARDLMAQLWIEKELLKHKIELISACEPFRGSDPANVLFRQIIGAFAQFEKSRITERLSGGRKQKAKVGSFAGGGVPIGFECKRGDKALSLDEEKSEVVKRVFQIKQENPTWPLDKIAAQLNLEGLSTKQNKPFHRMQVKRILDRSAIYQGQYKYAGIESQGQHQAIILMVD